MSLGFSPSCSEASPNGMLYIVCIKINKILHFINVHVLCQSTNTIFNYLKTNFKVKDESKVFRLPPAESYLTVTKNSQAQTEF